MSASSNLRSGTRLGALLFISVTALGTTGCASRAAPFDKLDRASVTVLRLQQQPQGATQTAPPALNIPGVPPELLQLGQQTLQQLQAQGIIPPGLLPGMPGAPAPANPTLPPFPRDNHWGIADQKQVVDPALQEELLDLFGDGDSFNSNRPNCFYPAMAVSFQSPEFAEPVDVVVSFSCNQAVGYGFQWPHEQSGLTPTTSSDLARIHQSLFGMPPS